MSNITASDIVPTSMGTGKAKSFKKYFISLLVLVMLVFAVRYFLWDKIKSVIIKQKLQNKVLAKTDSLYTIEYESLEYNETKGEAFMKNIRIIPDTNRVKIIDQSRVPYVMLDIKISSLIVKGVKTGKALKGDEIIADSIIINDPVVNVWFMKLVRKETRIDVEAQAVYRQILGNLKLIQVNDVSINNATVYTKNFSDHERQFDIMKTSIRLHDVRIDSSSYEDTSRIMFCRDAMFNVGHFLSYNRNREELSVIDINFVGKTRKLSFSGLKMNRFEGNQVMPLCHANNFILTGVNTFEAIKRKNLVVDSVACADVTLYRPKAMPSAKASKVRNKEPHDSSGFRHVYSIDVNGLYFPVVNLVTSDVATKKEDRLGRVSIKIKRVKADEIRKIQDHPIEHTGEAEIRCGEMVYNSDDGYYRHRMTNMVYDPLRQHLSMGTYRLIPSLPEIQFSKKAKVQKDRYDIAINNIAVDGMDFEKLLKKDFFAGNIIASSSSIKIFRDITQPLEPISKIGKFPHQVLQKATFPIDVKKIDLGKLYLEYKEKNDLSGRSGTIRFENSRFSVTNATNIPSGIESDNICRVSFTSRVLGKLPLKVDLSLHLDSKDGKFSVSGNFGGMQAHLLDEITQPMAMLKIVSGYVDNADFKFTGNDHSTSGDFVMKYRDLKISLLKKDKATGDLKKRSVMSFFANRMLKDENPLKGELRNVKLLYSRNPAKSFMNLIWKTIYSGIQQTIGLPGAKTVER